MLFYFVFNLNRSFDLYAQQIFGMAMLHVAVEWKGNGAWKTIHDDEKTKKQQLKGKSNDETTKNKEINQIPRVNIDGPSRNEEATTKANINDNARASRRERCIAQHKKRLRNNIPRNKKEAQIGNFFLQKTKRNGM